MICSLCTQTQHLSTIKEMQAKLDRAKENRSKDYEHGRNDEQDRIAIALRECIAECPRDSIDKPVYQWCLYLVTGEEAG